MSELAKLATALAKAQAEMGEAVKDKNNPFFKSTYADLTSCFGVMREPFSKNGLSICQTMRLVDNGTALKTTLLHSSGEFMESEMLLPNIADPQKIGSAITYFRRFMLCSICGITPKDDDDGNEASRVAKPPAIKPKHTRVQWDNAFREFNILLKDAPEDTMQKALDWCQVKDPMKIPYESLLKLIQTLKAK